VYVTADSGGTAAFEKVDPNGDSGIIYGDEVDAALKNIAVGGSGHAVYYNASPATKKRDATLGTGDHISTDSSAGWDL
jgi:hypothetical protein